MRTFIIYLALYLLLPFPAHSEDCDNAENKPLNKELVSFLNEIQGEYQIGECEFIVQTKRECINDQEWFYAEFYINKGGQKILMPFAFSSEENTAKWLHVIKGQFHIRYYEPYEMPRIYDSLYLSFHLDFKKVKLSYSEYYTERFPLRRKITKKLQCKGDNPWLMKEGSGVLSPQENIISRLIDSFILIFDDERRYKD